MKGQRIVALALGAFFGLAPAAPATAADPKPGAQSPQSTGAQPARTKQQATAFALKVTKVTFAGPGLNWVAQPGVEYAQDTAPGEYSVTVQVKNPSAQPSPKGAKKCRIEVKGGLPKGTYDLSYNATFLVPVSKLDPGQDINACYQKLTLTDPGKYFMYVYLKP